MKEGQRCPNCFQGNIETGRCNLCGFDRQSEKQNPMRLPEMSQLGNRYLIGRMLGCGGFGITYKAYDRWNQCGCAIKEFTPVGLVTREAHEATLHVTSHAHQEDFEHGKKRFMEEAEILKKLTGVPEVVQITDYFQQNNTAYFVMEYIQGANLRQLMHSFGGKIPFKDAASIIYRAGMALEQVHNRAGIFHRDISPENIMVNQEGKLKLIDFGSAKYLIGRHSQTLSVILKKGYAPPEQYSSTSSQGSYTDVYALAATFYYVVTGVMIPDAPDRFGGDSYQRLQDLEPAVSAEISQALDRALVLDNRQRTQSAAVFVSALSGERNGQERPYVKLSGSAQAYVWNIPINRAVMIGRSGELADIVPTKNGKISKRHCELFFDSGQKCFYLTDHSKNGTFLGEMRMEKGKAYTLRQGEGFSLGRHICNLEVGWQNG